MDIRPTDLPELRAELLQFVQSEHARWFYQDRSAGAVFRGTSADVLQQEEAVATQAADLYHLAEPMIELAMAAAPSLPAFELEAADLPSLIGFAFLGNGRAKLHPELGEIAAVLWRSKGAKVVFTFFADTEHLIAELLARGKASKAEARHHRAVTGRLSPMAVEAYVDLGSTQAYSDKYHLEGMLRIIRAAWLLMQQPLAQTTEAHASRAGQKRLRRINHEPRPVRVIELRRPQHSGSGDGSREYHHQWIVRGHWRQQWYPARQVHRPVWIAPHIKGPEGAPMLGGEKVYAWKR